MNYEKTKNRAKNIEINLWKNGGYYYLSGFIRGKHRQGIFSTLEQINRQLVFEEKYHKN